MKIYNPNREERAFLYQEAQGLEHLVKNLGSLSVMVEEMVTKSEDRANDYRVTFMVAPESFGMKVAAIDDNMFDATIAAKNEVVRQLSAIVNSMPRAPGADANDRALSSQTLH